MKRKEARVREARKLRFLRGRISLSLDRALGAEGKSTYGDVALLDLVLVVPVVVQAVLVRLISRQT